MIAPSRATYRILFVCKIAWWYCAFQIQRDGFDSRLDAIAFAIYTGWLLTGRTQAHSQSDLHYTRGVTPKRAISGGVHLRGVVPGQHSSEETSQRWPAVSDTLADFIGPGIEPRTSSAHSDIVNQLAN